MWLEIVKTLILYALGAFGEIKENFGDCPK